MKLQLADRAYQGLSEPISLTIAAIGSVTAFLETPTGKILQAQVEAWLGRVFPAAERSRLNAIIDELYSSSVAAFKAATGQTVNYQGGITAEFAAFTSYRMIELLTRLAAEPIPADAGGKRVKARYIQAAKDIMLQCRSRMDQYVQANPPAAPPVAPPIFIKPPATPPTLPQPPAPPVAPPAPAPVANVQNIGLAVVAAKLLGIF